MKTKDFSFDVSTGTLTNLANDTIYFIDYGAALTEELDYDGYPDPEFRDLCIKASEDEASQAIRDGHTVFELAPNESADFSSPWDYSFRSSWKDYCVCDCHYDPDAKPKPEPKEDPLLADLPF